MSGIYIASSPNPVAQVEFMRTLRKVIGMPIGVPALEWMVRIGAPLFLRTDPEWHFTGATSYRSDCVKLDLFFSFPRSRRL